MKLMLDLLRYMNPNERRLFRISLAIRTLLVSLDVVGLGLLGISASIASGTRFDERSLTGQIMLWLGQNQVLNPYAAVAALSVGFFLLKGVCSISLNFWLARRLAKFQEIRAKKLFTSILSSRLEQLEKWGPSDFSYALGGALDDAFGRFFSAVATMYGELILMVAVAVFLAYTSPTLFLALAAFFSVVAVLLHQFSNKRVRHLAKKLTDATLESGGMVVDSISNFRQLATAASLDGFTAKFSASRMAMALNQERITTYGGLPRHIMEMALMIGIGALVVIRTTDLAPVVPASVVAIFIGGALRLAASLLPLQGALAMLAHVRENARLPLAMLSEFREVERQRNVIADDEQPFSLACEKLSYSYPGSTKETLSNVTFSATVGDFIAVVGSSGAGKSTLADLLLGLREPTSGSVSINGVTPKEFRLSRPGAIAYVPQNTTLIQGTVLENIAFGASFEDIDKDKAWRALEAVHLDKFVKDLPEGIDTRIGHGFLNLSGGQSQRIGLARAVYVSPRILVLDEATSALDEESQAFVQQALAGMSQNLILIVIAHRLSTLSSATCVLRIRGGRSQKFSDFEEIRKFDEVQDLR